MLVRASHSVSQRRTRLATLQPAFGGHHEFNEVVAVVTVEKVTEGLYPCVKGVRCVLCLDSARDGLENIHFGQTLKMVVSGIRSNLCLLCDPVG